VQHDSDPAYTDIMWEVVWGEGVTESGSSGSPLFNAERQVIGQLCCGTSFCSDPDGLDWYGKSFASSWAQLSGYLDPAGTGQTTLDTMCVEADCPWDLDGSGVVDQASLVILIARWGQADPSADFDQSGSVDVLDLLALLVHWGTCP
jgi:hypothetical protein